MKILRGGGGPEILGTCVGGVWENDRVTRGGAQFFP